MCHPKTMLKIGLIIAFPLVIGAIVAPSLRATIIGVLPLLLFAVCPISMLACLWGLKGDGAKSTCDSHESPQPEPSQQGGTAV